MSSLLNSKHIKLSYAQNKPSKYVLVFDIIMSVGNIKHKFDIGNTIPTTSTSIHFPLFLYYDYGRFFFFSKTLCLSRLLMERQPKTEPVLGSNDHRNLEDVSIQELVSLLRTGQNREVKKVLVSRYEKLQTDEVSS